MSFLQTSGTHFTLDGKLFSLFGCTIYDALYSTHKLTDLIPKLDFVVNSGFNAIRFTNFMNQSSAVGSEFDETVYSYIDYILDQCSQRNLKVIFESTDIGTVSGNRGYSHGDANCLALFNSFFTWLGARINTINGKVYSQDDTIAIFSIWGEFGEPVAPATSITMFGSIAGYIRAAFPNALICPGGLKPEQIVDSSYGLGGYVPSDHLAIPNIDLCATEPYYTQQNMLDLFPVLKNYSVKRNKPWMCMEFGYNQSDKANQGDPQRAKNMKFIYQQGLKNGCAGFIFWNHDGGVGGGYGINASTVETYQMVKTFAKTTGYSPRLIVI